MKKIFLILLLTCSFLLSKGQSTLDLPYSIKVLNPKPLDAYYYTTSGTMYTSVAQVNSQIASGVRYRGMTVNILGVEYWYAAGILNTDLVTKGGGGGVSFGTTKQIPYMNTSNTDFLYSAKHTYDIHDSYLETDNSIENHVLSSPTVQEYLNLSLGYISYGYANVSSVYDWTENPSGLNHSHRFQLSTGSVFQHNINDTEDNYSYHLASGEVTGLALQGNNFNLYCTDGSNTHSIQADNITGIGLVSQIKSYLHVYAGGNDLTFNYLPDNSDFTITGTGGSNNIHSTATSYNNTITDGTLISYNSRDLTTSYDVVFDPAGLNTHLIQNGPSGTIEMHAESIPGNSYSQVVCSTNQVEGIATDQTGNTSGSLTLTPTLSGLSAEDNPNSISASISLDNLGNGVTSQVVNGSSNSIINQTENSVLIETTTGGGVNISSDNITLNSSAVNAGFLVLTNIPTSATCPGGAPSGTVYKTAANVLMICP